MLAITWNAQLRSLLNERQIKRRSR